MEGITLKAMQKLSVVCNMSTGLAHPLDESRTKELFLALHARGIGLSHDTIRNEALASGWPSRHADRLGELAARIGSGEDVRISHPRGWGEETVARLVEA